MDKVPSTNSSPGPRERFLLSPPPADSALSLEWTDVGKHRRRSTIHSYTIAVYHTLPKNPKAMKEIRAMTSAKAAKNLLCLSIAFMLIFTGFVSLQSLQSSLHPQGGLGVGSLSVIYGTTVISCLIAPWLTNRLTTKWTIILSFGMFTTYFAANFYPKDFIVLPLSVIVGALAGPMWSAQATYVTTLALTYAEHRRIVFESDYVINQFMGVFFGFYRCSQIWGNLISTLILNRNDTVIFTNYSDEFLGDDSSMNVSDLDGQIGVPSWGQRLNFSCPFSSPTCIGLPKFFSLSSSSSSASAASSSFSSSALSASSSAFSANANRGDVTYASTAAVTSSYTSAASIMTSATFENPETFAAISETTRYMLLTSYLACGLMAMVVLACLLDQITVGKNNADPEFSQSSWELCLGTVKMLKDTKCLLLMPLVFFVGLEQGFMFGDFTKAYVNCAMGMHNIGPILICFGTVSSVSSITIGCFSKHIKRFAFIIAGATFNGGLLIVLWLWRPSPQDVPNFYVVASCLGLCDAIWQTQTYTLFAVLFSHKQEAAFASYRMFHAFGCAMAFGYSYFLCVEVKVFILAGGLVVALAMYSVIEMKMQLQSQHIGDIVAL